MLIILVEFFVIRMSQRFGRMAVTFLNRGVEQLVARQAHNLEVGGSSPSSAT